MKQYISYYQNTNCLNLRKKILLGHFCVQMFNLLTIIFHTSITQSNGIAIYIKYLVYDVLPFSLNFILHFLNYSCFCGISISSFINRSTWVCEFLYMGKIFHRTSLVIPSLYKICLKIGLYFRIVVWKCSILLEVNLIIIKHFLAQHLTDL